MSRFASLAELQKYSTQAKYKYGIETLHNFQHAIEIDKRNGNTMWQDAT